MSGKGIAQVSRADIPQTDGAVPTATGEQLPICTKTHALDSLSMSGEDVQTVSGADIPEVDGAVVPTVAPSREQLSIRTKTHARPGEGMAEFACVDIPQTDGAAARTR